MLCVGDRISPKCNSKTVERVAEVFMDGDTAYAVCRWRSSNHRCMNEWKSEVRKVEDIERFFVVNEED